MVFSPTDEYICDIAPDEIYERRRIESINGEHSLRITTSRKLAQSQRLLTIDKTGKWREYVVNGVDAKHDKGERPIGTYYCVWSLQYDLAGVTCDKMPGVRSPVSASSALSDAISETSRWTVGTVTQTTTGGASMWQRSAWEALSVLVETWGGEIDATIAVNGTKVTGRAVDLLAHQGSQTVTRRFDYGADLTSIQRKVADGPVYARVIPLGKGSSDSEATGDRRRITIESVNGGIDYLENDQTAQMVRVPDGSGGWEYPTKFVIYDKAETPQALYDMALADLDNQTVPKVTYTASVLQLWNAGADVHGLALGDDFDVVDAAFPVDGGIRIRNRAVKLEVNELDEHDVKVTLGSVSASIASEFKKMSQSVQALDVRVQQQGVTFADFYDNLLSEVNAQINATGGYSYLVEGRGLVTYDVAVSDPAVGSEASQVVEIKGGTIRIANTKTSGGDWIWKTVLVSGHIATELITAGHITAGYIGDPVSGDYWDLDNHTLRITGGSTIAGMSASTLVNQVEATITDVDVEFAENQSSSTAPTSGWSTTAPAWREGWYIWQRTKTTTAAGSSYSNPVCISGRDGADGTSVTILTETGVCLSGGFGGAVC